MKRRIFLFAITTLVAIVLVLLQSTEWLASLGGRVTGARLERTQRSPQFKDGKFRNAEASR